MLLLEMAMPAVVMLAPVSMTLTLLIVTPAEEAQTP